MNYKKIILWLSICAFVGMNQVMFGGDYISYYDRTPTELEDVVFSTLGKSYNVESDLIEEQARTNIAWDDKHDRSSLAEVNSQSAKAKESADNSQKKPEEIQYMPAINTLPYADAGSRNHSNAQVRSLPPPTKDATFVESEYIHSEIASIYGAEFPPGTYHQAPVQETNSSQAKISAYPDATPPEYQSRFSLNPVSAEFYFTSGEDPATRASTQQPISAIPPEQSVQQSKQTKTEIKSKAISTPQTPKKVVEELLKPEKNTEAKADQPEIAVSEKSHTIREEPSANIKKEIEPDLIAYVRELHERSIDPAYIPERILKNIDEENDGFENICIEKTGRGYLPGFCLYAGHVLGKGVGYTTGYTSLGLWTELNPSKERQYQAFIDARGHVLDNGQQAANIGLGGRFLSDCLNKIFGANIYYDFRQGKRANYNQIGIGAEVLSACWDFRINGYIPVGRREGCSCRLFEDQDSDFFALHIRKERSLAGFDAELGAYLRRKNPCNCCDFDLYGAVGTYYFSTNFGPKVFGGQLRLAASWLNCINIEVIATSDRVFHERVQGRFEICIPLGGGWSFLDSDQGCCGNCACWPRSVDCVRVQRREIIALDECCLWETNFLNSSSDSCESGSDSGLNLHFRRDR